MVLADHGAPLGVSIFRAFSSAAAALADMLANSDRIGAMARARATESTRRDLLIAGKSRAAELHAARLGRCKAGFSAVADHFAFVLRDGCEYMNGQPICLRQPIELRYDEPRLVLPASCQSLS